jgi:hypothetical protein
MAWMTGVDRVDSSSRQKAMKNKIDRGVAGRSMATKNSRDRLAWDRLCRSGGERAEVEDEIELESSGSRVQSKSKSKSKSASALKSEVRRDLRESDWGAAGVERLGAMRGVASVKRVTEQTLK